MKRDTTYHCEAPDCESHQASALPAAEAPITGWVVLRLRLPSHPVVEHDFCSTDCAMKWCAQIDPPEIITMDQPGPFG